MPDYLKVFRGRVYFHDLASYFDEIRKNKILEYFLEKDIQCFFTSTEKLGIKGKTFYINEGEIIDEE